MSYRTTRPVQVPHAPWVRGSHWIGAVAFLTLAVSGYVILMGHPRLYWGEVGNDLTPALIELPISRNYQHGGWESNGVSFGEPGSAVSASRTYSIFNQNGWGRSLHFLAAWFLVLAGVGYLLAGLLTGHLWRRLVPRASELTPVQLRQDLARHVRLQIPQATGGPQYGLLQKCAYSAIIFLVLPLAVLTGLAMSPTITAAYPFLSGMFGGFQSARTMHFLASLTLVLFLLVHVLMVVLSGFTRQIRAMTIGG